MYLRKNISILFFLLIFASNVYSADSSSGCGAGWYILKKNSLISSTSRAMTNATFSNTIGMTLGTSNCAEHSIVKKDFQALHFSENSIAKLQTEFALGEGEYLYSLADFMGCSTSRTTFGQVMKKNYSDIFPLQDTHPQEMLNNIQNQINLDPHLSKNCTLI